MEDVTQPYTGRGGQLGWEQGTMGVPASNYQRCRASGPKVKKVILSEFCNHEAIPTFPPPQQQESFSYILKWLDTENLTRRLELINGRASPEPAGSQENLQ